MFCGKCGTKIEYGVNFCPKCGSSISEQHQMTVTDLKAAANNNTNIDKRKLAIFIIIAIIAAILIKTIFFSSPLTLSGNENNPKKLLKIANSYLSSEEFKNDDDNEPNYTAIDYVGKLGDYYQFVIIGTKKVDGKVIEYTEDDDTVMVLTENEDGITYVPINRWAKIFDNDDSKYKSNAINIIFKRFLYDYTSGDLIVYVDFHNGYSYNVTLKSFEITLFNGKDNPITDKEIYTLNESISVNSTNSQHFRISNDKCPFISDLRNVTYNSTINYSR